MKIRMKYLGNKTRDATHTAALLVVDGTTAPPVEPPRTTLLVSEAAAEKVVFVLQVMVAYAPVFSLFLGLFVSGD